MAHSTIFLIFNLLLIRTPLQSRKRAVRSGASKNGRSYSVNNRMEVRSMLTGILSRRNTASHRYSTRLRALPLNPLLLSQRYENTGGYRLWYPPATEVKAFPTAALSTSGIRVEGDSFLSACQNKLPCMFSCNTIFKLNSLSSI